MPDIDPTELDQVVEGFIVDMGIAKAIAQSDANTTVETENGPVDSLAKTIKGMKDSFEAGVGGIFDTVVGGYANDAKDARDESESIRATVVEANQEATETLTAVTAVVAGTVERAAQVAEDADAVVVVKEQVVSLHGDTQALRDQTQSLKTTVDDSVAAAAGHEAGAQAALTAAELARDQAAAGAVARPSIAIALADATIAVGASFTAPLTDGSLQVYRKDSTAAATPIGAPFPKAADVKGAIIGVIGKNKFNAATVTTGVALSDVGATFGAPGRNVSEYIPVLPSTAYRCSLGVNKLCWFSSASPAGFISFVNGPGAVASPGTAAFVRIDVNDASLSTVQMELGSSVTPYESFRYLAPSSTIGRPAIRARAVGVNEIDANVIEPWQLNDVYFLNMHDGSLVVGTKLNNDGTTEAVDATTNHTNWIPAKENTQYSVSAMSRAFFYRADLSLISMSASGASPFVTPAGCTGMKFNLFAPASATFQLNEGATASTPKQPYKYTPRKLYVPPATKAQITAITGRKYNLSDAWFAWQNNEKFPVAFLSDSTTNGNGTTGFVARVQPYAFGVDYVAPNAYPKVLENIVRTATGSTVARCYNLGFSGRDSTWALANIDAILSGDMADSKIVVIGLDINSRTANLKLYETLFRDEIEGLIVAILNKGMQPGLMTSQPTAIPNWPDASSSSGPSIEAVANRIKRDLAAKWSLEIVDVNRYGRDFQTYSAFPLASTAAATHSGIYEYLGSSAIHWNDIGHKYEAGLFFASICPRVLWSDKGETIDFANQFLKSIVNYDKVTLLEVPTGGWKIQAKYAKATAADEVLQDFWFFNTYRGRLNLTASAVDAPESAYVKLNGATTTMDAVTKAIGTLEMGLHHIEAWSGLTTAVNWRGFTASI